MPEIATARAKVSSRRSEQNKVPAHDRTKFIRYVAVGVCNTLFGYGCYALLTFLLTRLFPYGYMLAAIFGNIFSVTFAFFGYKWFVFRTTGNYFKEWIRCLGVYSVSMTLAVAALPLVVRVVQHETGNAHSAPYIAGAAVQMFSILFGFFGHQHVSFAGAKNNGAK